MFRKLLFYIFFIPACANAQYHISGKVIDSATSKPLPDASVYLSNATLGTKTNAGGNFDISGVKSGQYEFVVSMVGYDTYRQTIMINKDIDLSSVRLVQKPIQLAEVKIGPDPDWANRFEMFKKSFLGRSENAAKCEILNPHALDFDFNSQKDVLTASSAADLIIENRALGYRIRYQLISFEMNYSTHFLYFEGSAFFEDLPGRKGQLKRWQQNRLQTYIPSDMHFLRSVIAGRVKEEGFTVERLIKKTNPAWKGELGGQYILTLVTSPLPVNSYASFTNQKGEYALSFNDCLYIIYHDEKMDGSTINFTSPYAYFDQNGIIMNPQSIVFEGKWAQTGVADFLPVNYEPKQ